MTDKDKLLGALKQIFGTRPECPHCTRRPDRRQASPEEQAEYLVNKFGSVKAATSAANNVLTKCKLKRSLRFWKNTIHILVEMNAEGAN